MQVRFGRRDATGQRPIVNRYEQEVGQIDYDTGTINGTVRPYVIYVNGRGYLSRHAYLNDAKVAAREYFDDRPAPA